MLGPGALHWVRARGNAVHASWNIAFRTAEDFAVMTQLALRNEGLKSPLVIPWKHLVLHLLNHEYDTLKVEIVQQLA